MVKDNGIELFLDGLASQKATPSGGSAAAVMGAMGAALVSMVCNLTIGRTQYRDFEEKLKSVLTKAEELRRDLIKMIEEDVQAFDSVMRAYHMPRSTKDETATRAQVIQTALKAPSPAEFGVAQARPRLHRSELAVPGSPSLRSIARYIYC